MTLKMKAFKNIKGKGENAGYEHFLLFPQCFYPSKDNFNFLVALTFLSANAVNLDKSTKFSFGKGLTVSDLHTIPSTPTQIYL